MFCPVDRLALLEPQFKRGVSYFIEDILWCCCWTMEEKWSIDKLDGNNWSTWKFQTKHWGLVDGSEALEGDASAWRISLIDLRRLVHLISVEDQVVTLLGSLPRSYATFVNAFEARVDNIEMDYVQQALVHEEMKHFELPRRWNRAESALMGTKGSKSLYSPKCFRCCETGHISSGVKTYGKVIWQRKGTCWRIFQQFDEPENVALGEELWKN